MHDPYLDHPILTGRYFYPWPNRFDNPFFVEGDGFRLGCRHCRGHGDAPTIIHFHGNGEIFHGPSTPGQQTRRQTLRSQYLRPLC